MQKSENSENATLKAAFQNAIPSTVADVSLLNDQFRTMDIFEKLLGVADFCPVQLNMKLMQAFNLLQKENPKENLIQPLSVFTEILFIIHANIDFIASEYEKINNVYESLERLKNGR